MKIKFQNIIYYLLIPLFFSCTAKLKVSTNKALIQSELTPGFFSEQAKLKTYKGWWVYGEGQHIFKDEQTLVEYDLEFLDENMVELKELYLAVCEMEYFPMECTMSGNFKKDVLDKNETLLVSDFEILYFGGCED